MIKSPLFKAPRIRARRQEDSSPPKLFFCHIPKTGGTSLRRAIEHFYKPGQLLPDRPMMARYQGIYPPIEVTAAAAVARPETYRLLRGHYHLSMCRVLGDAVKRIVVFREPFSRTTSHLEHMIRHHNVDQKSIEAMLEEGKLPWPGNLMSRFILGTVDLSNPCTIEHSHAELIGTPLSMHHSTLSNVLDVLRNCEYVGITENLEELVNRLSDELFHGRLELRRLNPTPETHLTITTRMRNSILSSNELDFSLYETLQSMYGKKSRHRPGHRWSPSARVAHLLSSEPKDT